MEPFPTDVTTDIFSRLPAKSVARFRSLSKLWGSILSCPDFAELFLIRSCARPRLLFAVERYGQWSFFSSPQPQYPYDKPSSSSSSLVVAADFHTKFSADVSRYICSYASGLIHFPDMWIPRENAEYSLPVICNPITGKYVSLPEPDRYRKSRDFLGFDPIEKQFKVLAEAYPFCDLRNHHQILTLETGKQLSWTMKNHCPKYDSSLSEGICINGVLYYLARNIRDLPRVIVCFDVRSEEIKFIEVECFSDEDTTKLISYKGKLSGINWKYAKAGGRRILELCMWVLEDIEKPEWLNHVYTLSEDRIVDRCNFSVVGMTATGEIVLSMDYTSKPFYVCYFHPERKTLTSLEIQGFGADLEALEKRGRVHVFVDHVEDLSVNDAKQLKSSISAPSVVS